MPQSYTVLRVMHCGSLTSMKGVSLFSGLRELNLSSNSLLTMGNLEGMRGLEVLNLSCNKITQISNLQPFAQTLRKLILSHNRILSLAVFNSGPHSAPMLALEYLDLKDNYIGQLDEVKNLESLVSLKELYFQNVNSTTNTLSNPVCDFENYEEAVRLYLPNLAILDGRELFAGHSHLQKKISISPLPN